MNRAIVTLVVLLLAVSSVSAQSLVELDENTALVNDEHVDEFDETGSTTVEIERYSLTITIADDDDDLDDLTTSDLVNVWVQFDYRESIPRTFRVYIPRAYFSPIPKKGVVAHDSDVSADFLPVQDRRYTSITVQFNESDTASFAVSKSGGRVLDAKEKGRSILEREFNVTIPSFSGKEKQWSFVEPSDFEGNNTTVTLPVNGSAVVQYESDGRWLAVPNCESGGKEVCQFTKNDRIHVVSLTDSTPLVRYKEGNSIMSQVTSAWNDLAGVPGRIEDMVGGILESVL